MSILDFFRRPQVQEDIVRANEDIVRANEDEIMEANLPMSGWRYKIPNSSNLLK